MNVGKKGTALITGTTSGIGAAFAERLARDGYDLILVARRGDQLAAQAQRLQRETAVRAVAFCADLSKPEDLRRVEQRIAAESELTLLVNNAGRGDIMPFTQMSRELVENMIALNVTALTTLTHAALPGMLARGSGTIINVASGLSFAVMSPFSVYGATKAYVAHFTELLHAEVGAKGIRLQALVPGLTRTNLGNAEEKGFFDQFPAEMVMLPADLVDASLASLEMGELFCFPRLEDPLEWERVSAAMRAIGTTPMSNKPAARYGLAARRTRDAG
ncbi:MAG TPA: SDR family oxidoreductase [Steroidobacteraceae bacterium]|nr:SDR family oxidoreductase [Steroidobacteraceae bacterium]